MPCYQTQYVQANITDEALSWCKESLSSLTRGNPSYANGPHTVNFHLAKLWEKIGKYSRQIY